MAKQFPIHFNPNNSLSILLQISLVFMFTPALSPILTSDTSISINISIRSLRASEDSRNINISISFFLMLMLMFSEDIVDISISAR